MGDRAVIWVQGAPCALYLHNGGSTVSDLLQRAAPTMRYADPKYAQARLISAACADNPGTACGVGVVAAPRPNEPGFSWKRYFSDGAGVFIVDVDWGTANHVAGTGYGWGDGVEEGTKLLLELAQE